jgi:hypothetical protein
VAIGGISVKNKTSVIVISGLLFFALLFVEQIQASQASFHTYDNSDVPTVGDLAISPDELFLYTIGHGSMSEQTILSRINLPGVTYDSNLTLNVQICGGVGFIESGHLIVAGNRSPAMIETENSDHPLFIVSTDPFQVERKIEISGQMTGWVEGSDGCLYVVSGNPGVITVIEPVGFTIEQTIQLNGWPLLITMDADILLLGDGREQEVTVFDMVSRSITGEINLSGFPLFSAVKSNQPNRYFLSGSLLLDGNDYGLLMEVDTGSFTEVDSWDTVLGGNLGTVVDSGNGWLCLDGECWFDDYSHDFSLLGRFDLSTRSMSGTLQVLPTDDAGQIFSNPLDNLLVWAPTIGSHDLPVHDIQIIDNVSFSVTETIQLDPEHINSFSDLEFHPTESIFYIGSNYPVGLWVIDY